MKEGLFLTSLYLLILLVQPFLPSLLGDRFWLLSTTPILIAYASIRSGGAPLIWFIILGGLFHDFMFPDYLGMGPLLWGLTAFLVHSQHPWLAGARFAFVALAAFVASFFYFSFDRLLFLFYAGFWSWSFDLSFTIFSRSLVNAGLAPLLFWLFDIILKEKMTEQKQSFKEWVRST